MPSRRSCSCAGTTPTQPRDLPPRSARARAVGGVGLSNGECGRRLGRCLCGTFAMGALCATPRALLTIVVQTVRILVDCTHKFLVSVGGACEPCECCRRRCLVPLGLAGRRLLLYRGLAPPGWTMSTPSRPGSIIAVGVEHLHAGYVLACDGTT